MLKLRGIYFFHKWIHDEIAAPKVVVNDRHSAFQATEHLIQEGYRKIAHITVSKNLSISRERLEGYKDALKKHNIPVNEDWIVHSSFNQADIDKATRSLFKRKDAPDAILAAAERMLIGCMRTLKDMNLRIPEDVALIGFSDNPLNNLLCPSLSSIRQPTFEIGQKSVELLIELIENKPLPENYKTIQLETTLDIMSSSKRRQ